ncbi:hypothetical protein R3Q06_23130 [Rhodococcus erythropolis]|uniref:hypothetical protein n=1 Tax=Rhodococcus erythropolis TaxID=1833 RepID=UPI00294922CB|nr:hypothetical protein [Rhodococcus erythropolis]MDV6276396.1 hypothetical protein [Rhodococcus erythropolis]
MSGYQHLHDLITTHIASHTTPIDIERLTKAIYLEWLPTEVAAVNEAAEAAKKQLNQTAAKLEEIQVTTSVDNIGGLS